MMIVVGGMIGLGKTSVSELISKELGSDVFYENVENNPILPLFYTATEEEIQEKRYPFLLQLFFLNTRFKAIKQALVHNNNVLDRSIYEDLYFCKVNMELGRITELEFELYENILNNMLEELSELPKKAPDLMIYLKGSFDTVISRINKRGRAYELDPNLIAYYKKVWSGYDEWALKSYTASQILVVDMDNTDIINNREHARKLVEDVKNRLKDIRG